MDDVQRQFDVLKQRIDLDIDFQNRSLRGSTEITIQPLVKDLRSIPLHARQCRPTLIQVGGITAKWDYDDPYRRTHMSARSTVHQHAMLQSRIASSLRPSPEPQLIIALPPKLKIQELHVDPATALPLYNATPSLQKQESDAMAIVETPIVEKLQLQIPQFAPIKLTIEYEVDNFREGLHWIGCEEGDKRFPYLYTKLEPWPGNTSSIVPCVDDANTRCVWEISIRCPRTLGDAFRRPKGQGQAATDADAAGPWNGDVSMTNGIDTAPEGEGTKNAADEYFIDLNEEDAALELTVLCVGEPVDDIADPEDETRHIVTSTLESAVTARHIGFAIGPFESIDLTTFRSSDDEEKLKDTAVKVHGYCLPGRADEVENTCFPICLAVDFISVNYGRFPFKTYQMLFVDDAIYDTAAAAGLSICSTRLLMSQDIIGPLDSNTRILVRAVADQYSGVNVIPKEPTDAWAVAGIAGYLTDVFMKTLAGNNQYRWEQKKASERVYDLDVDRPSIHQLGQLLHLDSSIRDFLNLKSALVLGILDRRLVKSSGSTGCLRIVSKIFLNAKTGTLTNGELSTQDFQRTCEKLGHNKLEAFFRQWVFGSGCPIFQCSQRFNKKKLVVEMTIIQRQLERQTKPAFEPSNFMREVKEHVQEVWAPEPQSVFTGPMTIRIHEADGTPYEHIVEIKEPITKLEIPYNTKYKRLKRSRRQKERQMAEGNADGDGDGALLYCLGDILDTPEEMADWKLAEWTKEDEDKMGQESYEWIRMDADFEWIGKIHLVMPLYMYISQLQQDRDIVAQYESMLYLLGSNPHHVSLSILLRTLMDERYFYGIRVMAAEGIAKLSKDKLMDTGQYHLMKVFTEMFCENEVMPRPNDFSSRVTFIMQCAIPRAMAQLRDEDGRVPKAVQQFFVDKLKFNDNSDNAYSDCHYVATLMHCLTDSLVASHRIIQPQVEQTYTFSFGEEEPEELEPEEPFNPDADFELTAVNEIERYRRIDEWILTYQNIYSTTAIECLQKLTKAGIVKDKTKELLQYTRRSTADNVRLQAFQCLNEIGITRRMPMMKHLLYSLADDRSPYFRERLLRLFGEALGHIALGDDEAEKPQAPPPPIDGLVLEQEASSETRRIEATRKTTPEGALAALKVSLQDDTIFKQALWYATTGPDLALDEIAAFCEVAALMYDSSDALTVTLRLPKPYKCQHQGNGRMRFYQEGSYRIAPNKPLGTEDYFPLQSYGLKYSGPIAEEAVAQLALRKESEAKEAAKEAMKLKISQPTSQMVDTQQSMPPPQALPTPIEQKSGFKLTLGNAAAKRKASVDFGAREASPKIPKTSKIATPASSTIKIPKRSSQGPGKQSRVVILRFSASGAKKVEEILSSSPSRDSSRSPSIPLIQQSRLQTPASLLTESPTNGAVSGLTSFSAAPALNPGGFRSYGVADNAPIPSFTQSPVGENSLVLSPHNSPGAPPSLTSFTSMSPPAVAGLEPPKRKLTLKLGVKKPEG